MTLLADIVAARRAGWMRWLQGSWGFDAADAEDIIGEAVVASLRAAPELNRFQAARYLAEAVRRRAMRERRDRKTRERCLNDPLAFDGLGPDDPPLADILPAVAPDPCSEATAHALWDALLKLPAHERNVMVLLATGASYAAVQQALSLRHSMVAARALAARRRLREVWA